MADFENAVGKIVTAYTDKNNKSDKEKAEAAFKAISEVNGTLSIAERSTLLQRLVGEGLKVDKIEAAWLENKIETRTQRNSDLKPEAERSLVLSLSRPGQGSPLDQMMATDCLKHFSSFKHDGKPAVNLVTHDDLEKFLGAAKASTSVASKPTGEALHTEAPTRRSTPEPERPAAPKQEVTTLPSLPKDTDLPPQTDHDKMQITRNLFARLMEKDASGKPLLQQLHAVSGKNDSITWAGLQSFLISSDYKTNPSIKTTVDYIILHWNSSVSELRDETLAKQAGSTIGNVPGVKGVVGIFHKKRPNEAQNTTGGHTDSISDKSLAIHAGYNSTDDMFLDGGKSPAPNVAPAPEASSDKRRR